jgi:hypothetical protein
MKLLHPSEEKDMKHALTHQAKRAGIALAAAVAFSALGIGTAQAAPTFTTADISINSVGFIDCAFKETGLGAGASVNYTCGATDVGWLTQCFVKNKPVSNIAPRLHVAHNSDGLTTTQDRTATNRGTITSAILTAYPTAEENPLVPPLCPEVEGLVITEEITAIRWCNSSLMDTTNNILGVSEPTLFLQIKRNGTGTVPDCGSLATMPSDF